MEVRQRPGYSPGFTMTELMVAMFITILILGATVSAMFTGNRNQEVAHELVTARQNARMALKILERDIRGAGARLFQPVSPCGGHVYAHTDLTELDDYRQAPGSIRLSQDIYPLQVELVGQQVYQITVLAGGLDDCEANSHVFKVSAVTMGTGTMTITLANGPTDPQPNPEWTAGTLLLACGGDDDVMAGVIYKVTGGSFASGYTVEDLPFSTNDQEGLEAEYVRQNPKVVMDVSFLARQLTFQIDRINHELLVKFQQEDAFQPVVKGISDLRLLVDNGSGFVPITTSDTPKSIRIEVDALGPDEQVVTVAGLVTVRNTP